MNANRLALEVIVLGSRGFLGSTMHTSQVISIGSDPDSMIHLDDPSVSPKHAVFFLVGDGYCIKDLGSRTGTWVNGTPASAIHALASTDEITIGSFRLKVTIHRPFASQELPTLTGGVQLAPAPRFGNAEEPTAVHGGPRGGADLTPGPNGAASSEFDDLLGVFDGLLASAKVEQPPHAAPAIRKIRRAGDEAEAEAAASRLHAPIPTAPLAWSPMSTAPLAWSPTQPPPRAVATSPVQRQAVAAHAHALVSPSLATAPAASASVAPASMVLAAVGPAAPVPMAPTSMVLPSTAPVPMAPVPMAVPALVAPVAAVTGPSVPAPPPPETWSASWHDEDEDEDEDEDDASFEPPFDLLAALSERGLPAGAPTRDAVVEVVRTCRDRVISVRHLGQDQVLRLPGSDAAIGRCEQAGSFALDTRAAGAFAVRQSGRWLASREAELLAPGGKLGLAPGMQISVDVRGDDKLMVHLVPRVAQVPRPGMSFRVDKQGAASGASSAMVHIAALALIGALFIDKKMDSQDVNAGRFATIALKELELEPPPPPPEVVPAPRAETAPTKLPAQTQPPTRTAKATAAAAKRSLSSAKPSDSPAPEQPAASTAKILSALGSAAPSTLTATAITNLDAAPRGGGGGFKVSGAIGKSPGDTLRIAPGGSGGGQLDTKSATEVGTKVGRVEGRAGAGVVRARVTAIPQAIGGEGHLDRGEIQRVVNAHVHQVQACYERQLIKDPSLGGKITLEWVINGSGRVASARVRQSTVRSVEVASCIQSAISGWKFPSPQGGAVTVTYPFAFSTLGN